jgi:hypothetical protein
MLLMLHGSVWAHAVDATANRVIIHSIPGVEIIGVFMMSNERVALRGWVSWYNTVRWLQVVVTFTSTALVRFSLSQELYCTVLYCTVGCEGYSGFL